MNRVEDKGMRPLIRLLTFKSLGVLGSWNRYDGDMGRPVGPPGGGEGSKRRGACSTLFGVFSANIQRHSRLAA